MDTQDLKRVIPIGRENAIHLDKLAQALGVKEGKAKKIIQNARREGMDIVSGQPGYWFPVDDNERKTYYCMLKKQAISRFKTIKPMGDTLKAFQGQMSITEVLNNQSYDGGGGIGKEKE